MFGANVNTESVVRKLRLYCDKEHPKVTVVASPTQSFWLCIVVSYTADALETKNSQTLNLR